MKKANRLIGVDSKGILSEVVEDQMSIAERIFYRWPEPEHSREEEAGTVCRKYVFYQKRVAGSGFMSVRPGKLEGSPGPLFRFGNLRPVLPGRHRYQKGASGPFKSTCRTVGTHKDFFELHPVYRKKAERAAHILRERISNPPDLGEVVRLAQTNTEYIQLAFKACFGMTVIKYQRGRRLEFAKALLTDLCLTLDDIASRTGYSDASALSRAFYETFGIRPGRFRRKIFYCPRPRFSVEPLIFEGGWAVVSIGQADRKHNDPSRFPAG